MVHIFDQPYDNFSEFEKKSNPTKKIFSTTRSLHRWSYKYFHQMPVSVGFMPRWPTFLGGLLTFVFRWQDLKDEIRAQTKIECSFCEIHTPRDREGIGKMSKWDFVIYFLFSLLQQKRWNERCAQTYGWIWIERTKIRTPTCKSHSYDMTHIYDSSSNYILEKQIVRE